MSGEQELQEICNLLLDSTLQVRASRLPSLRATRVIRTCSTGVHSCLMTSQPTSGETTCRLEESSCE